MFKNSFPAIPHQYSSGIAVWLSTGNGQRHGTEWNTRRSTRVNSLAKSIWAGLSRCASTGSAQRMSIWDDRFSIGETERRNRSRAHRPLANKIPIHRQGSCAQQTLASDAQASTPVLTVSTPVCQS
jgi:hypothetical protein